MSVISIQEIWKGREGEGNLEETTHTRVFRIWTNNGADDETVVAAALALSPWNVYPGAVHPTDPRAFCVSCRPQNDIGPLGWIAVVTYSTNKARAQRPEDDDIEIYFDEEDIDVPVFKDRDGKGVTNSAGDAPPEPVMAQDSILIAHIELKAAAVPSYVRAYRKAINSVPFKIEDLTVNAKHGRVRRISIGKRRFRAAYPYRDVKIELAITDNDEDDWEIRFADAGYRRKRLVSFGVYKREKIVSDDGTDPTSPIFLDGSGGILTDPSPDTVVYREVGFYRLKNFIGNIPGCVTP